LVWPRTLEVTICDLQWRFADKDKEGFKVANCDLEAGTTLRSALTVACSFEVANCDLKRACLRQETEKGPRHVRRGFIPAERIEKAILLIRGQTSSMILSASSASTTTSSRLSSRPSAADGSSARNAEETKIRLRPATSSCPRQSRTEFIPFRVKTTE